MCAAVCPKEAITISLDKEGFYRPFVNNDKCIDCSKCTKYCYKFDKDIKGFNVDVIKKTKLFAAKAKDNSILSQTTSGGIADIISHALHASGYKCIGVVYDSSKDIAKNIVAKDEHELTLFRGSKYIQSYTLDAFKELTKGCMDEKYAIFGTPCHIYALHKYLESKNIRRNHFLIDMYCHGCPSMNLWKKYISKVHHDNLFRDKEYVVNFRSKYRGWGRYTIKFTANNGQSYISRKVNDGFFNLFFSDTILNEACHDCKLRETLQYTDIRLGDFWGKEYVFNHNGMSAVSIVTTKAVKIFTHISEQLYAEEKDYDNFLKWQSVGKKTCPNAKTRSVLLTMLATNKTTITDCHAAYFKSLDRLGRIKKNIKDILQLLPNWLLSITKYLFYKL